MDRASRWSVEKAMYMHTKQVYYLVACPPCKARGYRGTCRICDGVGKVDPTVAERLSVERDGERSP